MSGELLLEVRAEEIPARMLPGAVRQLAGRLFEDLTTRGLEPREVETGYTPRRLVVVLKGLAPREPDRDEQTVGPPVKVAYTEDGTPTKALEGFAKRCGVAVEDLERVATDKGEYVAATQHVPGRSAGEVLAELIPGFLASLSWAKNMRWGSGEGPWVRPVHGVLALLDGEVVPFALFGQASGKTTVGHPILSPEPFEVAGAEDYHAKLAERGILVRPGARREVLSKAMAERAAEAGGRVVEDEGLLDRLTAICEIPGVVEGRFDEAFLELPREVLVTSLKDHQSAFTVEGEKGLLPVFLTVMDRPDDPTGRVRAGNEWVVAARLEDARFFHGEDRKKTLDERAEELARLTFHVKLGSYAAKGQRLVRLAESIARSLGRSLDLDGDLEAAKRAAHLLKADLPTEMVKEFTDLQGVVGGLYARAQGEDEAVWQALYDQYLPASTDDPLPRGAVGRVTALADRLDTLAGMFGLGLLPTSSKDPFGLRRAAQGVVRILLEGGLSLDWEAAAAEAVSLYGETLPPGETLKRSPEEVLADLRPFVLDRVRHLLGLSGRAYDEIEAALAAGHRNLPDLAARAAAVAAIREDPSFLSAVLSAKRIANILKGQEARELEEDATWEEDAERELHAAYLELRGATEEALARGDHLDCLKAIGGLAEVLECFFDAVMVMAEDEGVRARRIALLQAIDRVTSGTARLTELVVDKSEHR